MKWINIPPELTTNLRDLVLSLNKKLRIILDKKMDYNSVSDTFTTVDGKTVTVVNGRITDIS